jgi:hypothetical protein
MSSIGGVNGGGQLNTLSAAAPKKLAVAATMVRDTDGDYDGTARGQVDAKDLGKGVNLDRRA